MALKRLEPFCFMRLYYQKSIKRSGRGYNPRPAPRINSFKCTDEPEWV
jgi:hypothetical protein